MVTGTNSRAVEVRPSIVFPLRGDHFIRIENAISTCVCTTDVVWYQFPNDYLCVLGHLFQFNLNTWI